MDTINRYFVDYSEAAASYIVFDRNDKVPGNKHNCAVLWRTVSTDKAIVQEMCDNLNSEGVPA